MSQALTVVYFVSYPIICDICGKGWNWMTAWPCDRDFVSLSCILLFSFWLCVLSESESDMENRAKIISWPQPADDLAVSLALPPVADTLHGFGRGERSGKLQRHHRVWTAAAWPLQVGTRHVAHTSLHYALVLLMPWWRQGSFQCTFKQNHKGLNKQLNEVWDMSVSSDVW